jgi:4-hydroxy-3-polyprenylbenzoate decarboxylase
MPNGDLRPHLESLEERGLLKWIHTEVDASWEIGSVLYLLDQRVPIAQRVAVGFDRVKGCPQQRAVAGAIAGTPAMIAAAFQDEACDLSSALIRIRKGIEYPIEPERVDSGYCKECILDEKAIDLSFFPVPVWTPGRDVGPYLTPLVVTKDPETGVPNVGIYRVQVVDGTHLCVYFSSGRQHGAMHKAKWDRLGRPMPTALVIGADPVIYFAGASPLKYGVNELAVAGGIRGGPLEMVACETINLEVPSAAEIVIEGELSLTETRQEGPYGEYTGYMCPAAPAPVMSVKCITHRRNPIWLGMRGQHPPSEEGFLTGLLWELGLRDFLEKQCHLDGINDVHLLPASGSLGMLWISVDKAKVAPLSEAILPKFRFLSMMYNIKWTVVVDHDVDIRDPFTREWVLSFRVRPDRDIQLLSNTQPLPLDPSLAPPDQMHAGLTGSKILIDATRKWAYPERAIPEEHYIQQAERQWVRYQLPPLHRS